MKPQAAIRQCAQDLPLIDRELERTLANLDDWAGLGWPTGNGTGRGTSDGSSTERFALNALEREERDCFARDRAQIAEDAITAALALRRMATTIDRLKALPRDPVTGNVVVAPAPGCAPCAMVKDPATGKGHENGWQKIYRRRLIGGNTEQPVCSWHSEWWDRYECAPAAQIEQFHLDHPGQRIPYSMIRDHHPEAFSLAQSKQRGALLGRHRLGMSA